MDRNGSCWICTFDQKSISAQINFLLQCLKTTHEALGWSSKPEIETSKNFVWIKRRKGTALLFLKGMINKQSKPWKTNQKPDHKCWVGLNVCWSVKVNGLCAQFPLPWNQVDGWTLFHARACWCGCGPPVTIDMRILYQSKLMLNYLYSLDRTTLSMPPFKSLHKYCISFVHNVILVIIDTISIECIILEIMISMIAHLIILLKKKTISSHTLFARSLAHQCPPWLLN